MNRGYTARQYYEFVERAREMMPDVSIASDFIVGFPTETEQDFAASVEMIRRCRFKNSFIFKYSPRPGTVAIDRFEDDVPEEVKRRRNNQLLAEQAQVSAENNRQMIGWTVEVIVEGESKLVSRQSRAEGAAVELGWEMRAGRREAVQADSRITQLVGRTRGDQIVCFDGPASLRGQILDIRIIDARNLTLFGRLVQTPAAVS